MQGIAWLLRVCVFLVGLYSVCLAQQLLGQAASEDSTNPPQSVLPNPVAVGSDKPSKVKVPDAAAVEDAQNLIRQIFDEDYKTAAENPEPFIQKLLAAARQTEDVARKYALLLSAEHAAVIGGDHARTMELIDSRASEFMIDELQCRIERLAELLTPEVKTDPGALASLYEHALETAERGMKRGSFDQAKAAAEIADSVARRIYLLGNAKKNDAMTGDGVAKQTQARSLVKDIERRARLFAEYQRALQAIQTKEDPAAMQVVGQYLCFEIGEWTKGLPFLAKGELQDLAAVASKELKVFAAEIPDAEAQEVFVLAGGWWDIATTKGLSDSARTAVKAHAAGLYTSMLDQLDDPLDKALAEKRIRAAVAQEEVVRHGQARKGPARRTKGSLVELSRVAGEGYARLVQADIMLEQGKKYRFKATLKGEIKLHHTDHFPGFNGPEVTLQHERITSKGGWTLVEATVSPASSATYELGMALWSLDKVLVAEVSLIDQSSGAELVRNGSFQDGINDWRARGGVIKVTAER